MIKLKIYFKLNSYNHDLYVYKAIGVRVSVCSC